ncbi:MAG: recombinase family protein, partial [Chlamydiae bacterium]|nr:recombinase family protein [Chlamydiota bacterium]
MENICAIYLRVSSDPQNPQNQIADVKKFAEALKCKIFEIYVDKESGKHSDRREFQRMMADARAGKFKMLFIWALDRFSREGIKATLTHIEELKEVGVSIRSYQESWLDTSNEGIWPLLVAILSWAANQELKRFAERSMAGKRTMLNDGKLIGCYPPYGYRYFPRDKEKGTYAYFEVDEYEASIVRKIFNWYLKFESILMVVYALKKEGIKGRGKGRIEPGFMQASAVSKILRRETYIGNYYFGKSSPCIAKFHIKSIRKPGLTGRRKNPKSEWKLIRVAEIIEKEIFYKTQEVLEKRAKHRIEMSKYEFLCQGLIRCIDCGKSYGGRMQHGDYLFYRCPQAYSSNVNQPACRSRTMGRDKLDRNV